MPLALAFQDGIKHIGLIDIIPFLDFDKYEYI